MADLARERAVAAGVRAVAAGQVGAAIRGGRDPGECHDEPHVFFAHAEVDDRRAATAADLDDNVDRRDLARSGDVSDRFAGPIGLGGVAGDFQPLAVVTTAKGIVNRLADARRLLGIVEPATSSCVRRPGPTSESRWHPATCSKRCTGTGRP